MSVASNAVRARITQAAMTMTKTTTRRATTATITVHYRCMLDLNITMCLFVDTRNRTKDMGTERSRCVPMPYDQTSNDILMQGLR
ncbi:hypothetical protein PUN28_003955 [Cardiocondyla obscurior]|uniref:Uncharacterized protein n=1 Tax=Cardiocondyla obscurior TaxID=286306 RepID=A0AAW2GP99_9HYME